MKKRLIKTLCIILPIVITLSVCGIVFYKLQRKEHCYYVINGGTGDGKDAKNPAASVLDVIKTINEDELTEKDNVKVYIMQREDYDVYPEDEKHFKTYWAKGGKKPESHTAKITVLPYSYENATELAYSDTLNENQVIQLSGPTTFKGIKVVSLKETASRDIFINGNDFITERDVTFGGMTFEGVTPDTKSYTHCQNLADAEKQTYSNPINIELLNKTDTTAHTYIGNNTAPDAEYTFKEDVNITLNCQDYERGSRSYPITLSNRVHFEKNLNIYGKRALTITFNTLKDVKVTVDGGVQFIYNSGAKIKNDITAIRAFEEGTKIWSICLEATAENCIEPTEKAGEFTVTKDITLLATDKNGNTVSSSNGILKLEAGSWTVGKKESLHYGDANSDGKIDSKDVEETEKLIQENKYYPPADVNCDQAVNDSDLALIKEHISGKRAIKWESYNIELCETLNLSGGADKEAEELKENILNSKNTKSLKGTIYYISENGDEFNEGTSPDEPLSIDALNILYLLPGDAVLFERGSVFRLTEPIMPNDGVYYGAYGKGEKPQFLGSLRDYAEPTIWTSGDGVIWQTELPLGAGGGNVIFNNGESVANRKLTLDKIAKDGDYYFDPESRILYLKLNQYNPGHYFDNIEIANIKYIFRATGSDPNSLLSDIYFENLSLKYPSTHAFSLNFGENITITNCEISWVGGDWYGDKGTRLGNAVEFWSIAKGNKVTNNYIHQIYDAAVTFQGTSYNDYTDLTIENNLIEYCSMNFEFWASENSNDTSSSPNAKLHNISVSNNIFRFGGYGYSNLYRSDRTDQAYILAWYYMYEKDQVKNFNIKGNIFDIANSYYFYGQNAIPLINVNGNTYYQKSGSINKAIRDHHFYSDDQASLEAAVKFYDKNPKKIEWID